MHGSAYDYLQNNATNARSILTLPGFNTLRQNQFGATLGGPLEKDKAFFFLNYEAQRRAHSPTYPRLFVHNPAALQQLSKRPPVSPGELHHPRTPTTANRLA